jgi:uncharacterized cupredoxin-like copper-binding protein
VLLLLSCALIGLVGCVDESARSAPGGVEVRVVEMTMKEMSFEPSDVTVKAGETITFRITNKGTIRHEAVFGTQAMQDAAVAKMAEMDAAGTTLPAAGGRSKSLVAAVAHPGMGMPNVISLEAGKTGDITFRFDEPAEWLIECHEKGHLEAGMAGTLTILPA